MSSRRSTFLPSLAALGALCCQPVLDSEVPGSSPYLISEETPQGAAIVLDPERRPRRFREAPMLARLVAQGKLPPVEDRLPENPLVLHPIESIGRYGGGVFGEFLWGPYAPAHYLKQFHPSYVSPEDLRRKVRESQQEDWVGLMKLRNNYALNRRTARPDALEDRTGAGQFRVGPGTEPLGPGPGNGGNGLHDSHPAGQFAG